MMNNYVRIISFLLFLCSSTALLHSWTLSKGIGDLPHHLSYLFDSVESVDAVRTELLSKGFPLKDAWRDFNVLSGDLEAGGCGRSSSSFSAKSNRADRLLFAGLGSTRRDDGADNAEALCFMGDVDADVGAGGGGGGTTAGIFAGDEEGRRIGDDGGESSVIGAGISKSSLLVVFLDL